MALKSTIVSLHISLDFLLNRNKFVSIFMSSQQCQNILSKILPKSYLSLESLTNRSCVGNPFVLHFGGLVQSCHI